MNNKRIEFGDWQTPYPFAKKICLLLKEMGLAPTVLVEPTCGTGNFIRAALDVFNTITAVYAIEIQRPYIDTINTLSTQYAADFHVYNQSIFDFDCSVIPKENVLLLGNPPWITNSDLGTIGGKNLPPKQNIKGYKGIEAITGRGNFDISEYIVTSLFNALAFRNGNFAFLLKNAVIRNIVYNELATRNISDFHQYKFDAKKEFGASTNASLFVGKLGENKNRKECCIYNLYSKEYIQTFALVNNRKVFNTEAYEKTCHIDGVSPFTWRSGIKHDCANIMELDSLGKDCYINGLHQIVRVEKELLYPLVKSSDIVKYSGKNRRFLLLPQKNSSEDTSSLQERYPLAYRYLTEHASYFENRKSIIYKNRPKFSIFGIGDYSFMPYKIAISSLYKTTRFTFLHPINGKPVMLDDTCYTIGFDNEEFAMITLMILNSSLVQEFINAISANDAKRVVTKELLMRIDIGKAFTVLTCSDLNITELQRVWYANELKKLVATKAGLFCYA